MRNFTRKWNKDKISEGDQGSRRGYMILERQVKQEYLSNWDVYIWAEGVWEGGTSSEIDISQYMKDHVC